MARGYRFRLETSARQIERMVNWSRGLESLGPKVTARVATHSPTTKVRPGFRVTDTATGPVLELGARYAGTAAIEAGTAVSPTYAPFRRAATEAGARVDGGR